MGKNVTVGIEDGIATVAMDDGKANAMSAAMIDELNACLDEAEASAKATVLSGRPGVFSGGFDLNSLKDGAKRTEMMHKGAQLLSRLFSSPIPVVAAVTGHAFALGAVIAMACDYAVGEEGEYRFALNETAVGIVFNAWASEIIGRSLTPKHLHSAAVLAKVFELPEAAEAGFVKHVAPAGGSVAGAVEFAKYAAQHDPEVYRGQKEVWRGEGIRRVKADVAEYLKIKEIEI